MNILILVILSYHSYTSISHSTHIYKVIFATLHITTTLYSPMYNRGHIKEGHAGKGEGIFLRSVLAITMAARTIQIGTV